MERDGKIRHHTFYNDDFTIAADSFAVVSVFKTARRRQVEERTRGIQREENNNPTGAGKPLSIWTIIGLRVENQRSPVPQGAAGPRLL